MLSDCEINNYPIAQHGREYGILFPVMDTVLLFQQMDSSSSRLRLEGLGRFAKEVGWTIQSYEKNVSAEEIAVIRDFWHPVGTILSVSDSLDEYDASLFSPDSTVLLDCFPPVDMERFTAVITDNHASAELAARELLATPCAAYAFVPWSTHRVWSDNRRQNFSRLLARRNLRLNAFTPSRWGLDLQDFLGELVPWLRTLPKPLGLFVANDAIAVHVLNACRLAGFAVPFDCVVVSVDDHAKLCEGATPTLSSVTLDFRTSGYRAGELLNELVSGRLKDRPLVSVPPLGFTRRNSSRTFLKSDGCALRASELIRLKACSGLTAKDVLPLFPCSRRLAEIRFRKATGRSVGEEIVAVRIERAKELLRNPFQRLDVIAEQCGYSSDTTFRRIFKRETGMTLREWQQAASRGAKVTSPSSAR